jgi:hypothetical protein
MSADTGIRAPGAAPSPRAPHLNQPGGRLRESLHPGARGRERELRALADSVRRLIDITVKNVATSEWTAAAAAEIDALADRLQAQVPAEILPRYAGPPEHDRDPHDYFQFDCMLGLYNPIALPVEMEWQAPRAIGRACFGTPYEGPPGCLHGAILAGVFDQVFNVANLMGDVAGPTVELSLRYKKPTPLHTPLVFEAWVESAEERRTTTRGHVRHGDTVTVEAVGVFARIDRNRILRGLSRPRAENEGA